MAVSALRREIAAGSSDLREVVAQTLALQTIAERSRPHAADLAQVIADKAAGVYGSTLGHVSALAGPYLAGQLVPELISLIHLVVVWLSELLPGM